MKVLVVVDMQNDFIDGSLPAYNAENILNFVKNKIENFDGEVVYTMDSHDENYLNTLEGKKLPIIHCKKNTVGWNLRESIYKENSKIFEKDTFASLELAHYLKELNRKEEIKSIEILGICTDICVISNAMLIKAFLPNVNIKIHEKGCAGVSLESHNFAINSMEMCHIDIDRS